MSWCLGRVSRTPSRPLLWFATQSISVRCDIIRQMMEDPPAWIEQVWAPSLRLVFGRNTTKFYPMYRSLPFLPKSCIPPPQNKMSVTLACPSFVAYPQMYCLMARQLAGRVVAEWRLKLAVLCSYLEIGRTWFTTFRHTTWRLLSRTGGLLHKKLYWRHPSLFADIKHRLELDCYM